MSRSAAFDSASVDRDARGVGPLARVLLGAAALSVVAGVAAVTLLEGLGGANEVPRLVPVPPAPAELPAMAAGGTSVPDAATVFAGREAPIEELAPTF